MATPGRGKRRGVRLAQGVHIDMGGIVSFCIIRHQDEPSSQIYIRAARFTQRSTSLDRTLELEPLRTSISSLEPVQSRNIRVNACSSPCHHEPRRDLF